MPKFLTRSELFRVLERELPEDCYADGAPSAFYTTADMDSLAAVLATAYQNLERVYLNYYPQSSDERIGDWEVEVFGQVSDGTLTLQERRDRVVGKLRARPGITLADMYRACTSTLPEVPATAFDIIEWGCMSGGWVLDESELDVSTYLNGQNLSDAVGPDLCHAAPSAFGKTAEEWAEMQEEAYTFEVLIYDQTLTDAQRARLDSALLKAEPARSHHVITDNQTPP